MSQTWRLLEVTSGWAWRTKWDAGVELGWPYARQMLYHCTITLSPFLGLMFIYLSYIYINKSIYIHTEDIRQCKLKMDKC